MTKWQKQQLKRLATKLKDLDESKKTFDYSITIEGLEGLCPRGKRADVIFFLPEFFPMTFRHANWTERYQKVIYKYNSDKVADIQWYFGLNDAQFGYLFDCNHEINPLTGNETAQQVARHISKFLSDGCPPLDVTTPKDNRPDIAFTDSYDDTAGRCPFTEYAD